MTVRGMLPALIATTQLVGCAGLEPAADSGVGGLREAAREVEALERAYHLALAVGDRARQEQLLAEDYLFVTPIGEVLDREATMNDLRAFEFVSRVDDLQLRVSDSGDTVVLTMKATAVHPAQEVREVRTVRIWSRQGGAWRATVGQQTSLPGTPPNAGGQSRASAAEADSPSAASQYCGRSTERVAL